MFCKMPDAHRDNLDSGRERAELGQGKLSLVLVTLTSEPHGPGIPSPGQTELTFKTELSSAVV